MWTADGEIVRRYRPNGNGAGAKILDALYVFLGRFVVYPSDAAQIAHALWIMHTHLMDRWDCTPRLAFLSPEPASGKSRALEVTELLVPSAIIAVNATPAYLFRRIGDDERPLPTVLFDEIDAIFGSKAPNNEDLRALLNAGYRRGATACRCALKGKNIVLEELPAFCACAMAGLGSLPDTILSRAIIVKMRRRTTNEVVEPFRRRLIQDEARNLRDRLAIWAGSAQPRYPDLPEGIVDRNAEIWEPLLAVAQACAPEWHDRANEAALSLVSVTTDDPQTLGILLLRDLRAVFSDAKEIPTSDLLARLQEIEEAPWSNIRGKPLSAQQLAKMLKSYGVTPRQIRVTPATDVTLFRTKDGVTDEQKAKDQVQLEKNQQKQLRGYERSDLEDPWSRYLAPML